MKGVDLSDEAHFLISSFYIDHDVVDCDHESSSSFVDQDVVVKLAFTTRKRAFFEGQKPSKSD